MLKQTRRKGICIMKKRTIINTEKFNPDNKPKIIDAEQWQARGIYRKLERDHFKAFRYLPSERHYIKNGAVVIVKIA